MLDVGSAEDGSPFLVMELLDGEPLDAVMDRAGKMRPIDILPIVRDVARTLSLAHERGVVHRDLKPANLFLHRLPTGQVIAKVLDFGISKVRGPIGKHVKTRTGTVVGSPVYMSPEQAYAHADLDARSDVHALGVILYQALSGRLPFDGESANAIMIKIATQDPPPLAPLAPGAPKAVIELVRAATMRDRDQRIASTALLADRIEAALASMGASRSLPVPSLESLRGPPIASVPATGAARRAEEVTRTQDDAAPLGVARTQEISQQRSKRGAPWPAIVAGALLVAAALAFLAWRAIQPTAVQTQADPTSDARTSAPAPAVAPAPARTNPEEAPEIAPATAPPATAPPPASATPQGVSSGASTTAPRPAATPTPTSTPTPTQKKIGGAWGYD